MLKFIAFFVVLLLAYTLFSSPIQAKTRTKSPSSAASFTKNKKSIALNFSNLTNVKSVSYQITYDSNKGPQGAGGTFKVKNSSKASRSVLLGTCSHKVCTYHRDIKNAKVSVDFTLKSGGVVSYEKKL